MAKKFPGPEVRDLLDMMTDPSLVDTFKKNIKVRLPVARVGDKLLSVILDPNEAGEYEVSSEWSLWSANSDTPTEVSENGHRFCIRR
jgi:hypothetical protein